MAKSDELRKEVGVDVDPPSLTYFANVAEMDQWLSGDDKKRGQLEKRWRGRYAKHRKQRKSTRPTASRDGDR
jgi:hypothetical protein